MTRQHFSARKFRSIRIHSGRSPEAVDARLRLPSGTCESWETGGATPELNDFLAACALLRCGWEDVTTKYATASKAQS